MVAQEKNESGDQESGVFLDSSPGDHECLYKVVDQPTYHQADITIYKGR